MQLSLRRFLLEVLIACGETAAVADEADQGLIRFRDDVVRSYLPSAAAVETKDNYSRAKDAFEDLNERVGAKYDAAKRYLDQTLGFIPSDAELNNPKETTVYRDTNLPSQGWIDYSTVEMQNQNSPEGVRCACDRKAESDRRDCFRYFFSRFTADFRVSDLMPGEPETRAQADYVCQCAQDQDYCRTYYRRLLGESKDRSAGEEQFAPSGTGASSNSLDSQIQAARWQEDANDLARQAAYANDAAAQQRQQDFAAQTRLDGEKPATDVVLGVFGAVSKAYGQRPAAEARPTVAQKPGANYRSPAASATAGSSTGSAHCPYVNENGCAPVH